MRRVAKVDANQHGIVKALRAAGASVAHTHQLGCGFPDIAVGLRGVTYLMEIKSKKGTLTPDELDWHLTWRGQVSIVRGAEEALRAIGVMNHEQ